MKTYFRNHQNLNMLFRAEKRSECVKKIGFNGWNMTFRPTGIQNYLPWWPTWHALRQLLQSVQSWKLSDIIGEQVHRKICSWWIVTRSILNTNVLWSDDRLFFTISSKIEHSWLPSSDASLISKVAIGILWSIHLSFKKFPCERNFRSTNQCSPNVKGEGARLRCRDWNAYNSWKVVIGVNLRGNQGLLDPELHTPAKKHTRPFKTGVLSLVKGVSVWVRRPLTQKSVVCILTVLEANGQELWSLRKKTMQHNDEDLHLLVRI